MPLGDVWGSVRGPIRACFTFANIKDLVGAAGLPVVELAHLRQRAGGGASKGQLMDAIDGLVAELDDDERDRFVATCIHQLLTQREDVRDEVEDALARLGWGVSGTEPYPLALQLDAEATNLSEDARVGISTCLRRYRDGEMSGAVTAVCGVVDSLTEALYEQHNLGNHREDSYQQCVVRSMDALQARYRQPLDESGLNADEQNRIWRNHRQAVNQAAYVLGSFRREFSDAHGPEYAPPEVVQRAVDCAVFIVRTLANLSD